MAFQNELRANELIPVTPKGRLARFEDTTRSGSLAGTTPVPRFTRRKIKKEDPSGKMDSRSEDRWKWR